MDKKVTYEQAVVNMKAAFFDVVKYNEDTNNSNLNLMKEKMNELIQLLDNEPLSEKLHIADDIKEEVPVVKEDMSNVNEDKIFLPSVEINNDLEQETKVDFPQVEQGKVNLEEDVIRLNKTNEKRAKAILIADAQSDKLHNSKKVQEEIVFSTIKAREKFIKAMETPKETVEEKVARLEEQLSKYYEENNFEMAEKIIEELKNISE